MITVTEQGVVVSQSAVVDIERMTFNMMASEGQLFEGVDGMPTDDGEGLLIDDDMARLVADGLHRAAEKQHLWADAAYAARYNRYNTFLGRLRGLYLPKYMEFAPKEWAERGQANSLENRASLIDEYLAPVEGSQASALQIAEPVAY